MMKRIQVNRKRETGKMFWLILSIAALFLIFISIAIVHVGAEADRAEQILHERYLKERQHERQDKKNS